MLLINATKRRGDKATHTTSYEENFLIVELFCMKNKDKIMARRSRVKDETGGIAA